MSKRLLSRIRELNRMLSESTTGYVAFDELCDSIGEMLESEVLVMSKRGKILASRSSEADTLVTKDESGAEVLKPEINSRLLKITTTRENVTGDDITKIIGDDYNKYEYYHIIVPVIFGGNRVATVVLLRENEPYDEEDIAITEYGATVVGLEVSRSIALEEEADSREKNAVDMALETLSYSELDAVVKIFGELEGNEGLLVASKVADKFNITRSVIVNALRKLESAGVIESRSLGMKGTRIKITNNFLRDQIAKIDI
ncbi:MAG: GTP-sensing pleiotropic transcriptional regulator CodY [Eubacterium sp.]|uniref:GTP-sensing pleiotropic transcriptional regulator CodY n=1 Tax=Eubacterium sp. F2 TaxID=3381348 RepID=UPI003908246B|nr:GTP-sensing pleiotropic transcriptional regulator CodY [Eubacterium sp.]MCI2197064.1 GTP-sensing pleiotropic transcriptional regulator CodY [Eubacterium sp.]